jgi:probable rRNA maturation factor
MYQVTVQRVVPINSMPNVSQLKHWAKEVLRIKNTPAELAIRIVGVKEITDLNFRYRNSDKGTNVLSFPFDMPKEINDERVFLGDIIICADIVNKEAHQQGISKEAHWAHMVVHGILHLLGLDHETDSDAAIMEPEEIKILQTLGFPNPYQ